MSRWRALRTWAVDYVVDGLECVLILTLLAVAITVSWVEDVIIGTLLED